MKKIVLILLIIILHTACKKDVPICANYTELKGQSNLVDITPLKTAAPELIDTLNKYQGVLQVYRVETDQYSSEMFCHFFYKGIEVFTDDYLISKDISGISTSDTIADSLTISSLTPSIDYQAAIQIARNNMNYDKTCISYRLGIYDIGSHQLPHAKNYKLVWQVKGDSGFPYVYLDAISGQVYDKFDGLYY